MPIRLVTSRGKETQRWQILERRGMTVKIMALVAIMMTLSLAHQILAIRRDTLAVITRMLG